MKRVPHGFFDLDEKEMKDAEVTCDVRGCDCPNESYLYDDEMDICLSTMLQIGC